MLCTSPMVLCGLHFVSERLANHMDSMHAVPDRFNELAFVEATKVRHGLAPAAWYGYFLHMKTLQRSGVTDRSPVLLTLHRFPDLLLVLLAAVVKEADRELHSDRSRTAYFCPFCYWWFTEPTASNHLRFITSPNVQSPRLCILPPPCRSRVIAHWPIACDVFEDTATASNVIDTLKGASDPFPCKHCGQWISGLSYLAEHHTPRFGKPCMGLAENQSGIAKRSPWIPRARVIFRSVLRSVVVYKHLWHHYCEEYRNLAVHAGHTQGQISTISAVVMTFLVDDNCVAGALLNSINLQQLPPKVSRLRRKYHWIIGR